MSMAGALAFIILAPVAGAILAGIDRKLTARVQSRVGPPILQPFYDVMKLFGKQGFAVNRFQGYYAFCFLLFTAIAGAIFFSGGDLLLVIFVLTTGAVFLVLGAYAPDSPYSNIGAERELLQMMAYEPALLIAAMCMYMATGSFKSSEIASWNREPLLYLLPGAFLGFLFVLTIKLRKSPFDLSTSHHAHQELVKGLTTEFSGPTLALVEIAHWYENILLIGFVYLFFTGFSPSVALVGTAVVYLAEIFVDNMYARLTWQVTVKSSWIIAGALAAANLLALGAMRGMP